MAYSSEPAHRPRVPKLPAAGWLPDPSETDLERYWDGSRWTSRTRDRYSRIETGVVPASAPARRGWRTRSSGRRGLTGRRLSITLVVIIGLTVSYQSALTTGFLPSWATPSSIVAALGKPGSFDTDYPVFGSSELVNHLERGMVLQEARMDITYWLETEGRDAIESALYEAEIQNPYLFASGWDFEESGSRTFIETTYTYSDEEAERRRTETLAAVQEGLVASDARAAASDRDKATLIHDYIVSRSSYDRGAFDAIERGQDSAHVNQSQEAYGIFVFGSAVCAGYAKAFTAMAEAAGLDAVTVTGSDTSGATGGNHAWNKVRVDGRWLLVDTTWDDPMDGEHTDDIRRDYLLLADDDPLLATRTDDDRWVAAEHRASFAS